MPSVHRKWHQWHKMASESQNGTVALTDFSVASVHTMQSTKSVESLNLTKVLITSKASFMKFIVTNDLNVIIYDITDNNKGVNGSTWQ